MMLYQVGKVWARRGMAQRRGWARRCPSCGSGLPTALPVCAACRYVGKVDESVTHHALLGVPYEPNPFVVDTSELKQRFLEAQRLCHPDGWATRSAREQKAALAVTSAVNTAYKTLASPIERIGYVLGRNGKGVSEGEQVEDTGLIMEVMETREAIEQSGSERLGRLKAANDDKMTDALGEIERAVGDEDWTGAKRWAVRLKYLTTLKEAILHRAENADDFSK